MQSGSKDPTYDATQEVDFAEWFKKIMSVLLLIVVVAVLGPLLLPLVGKLLKMVFAGIKTILEIIWPLLKWPFKVLFDRSRK